MRRLFKQAEREQWRLVTTSYVVHETWALVQHRLGWNALDDFLQVMLPLCEIVFVDAVLHADGSARCRRERLRRLSLTDCVSFEYMKRLAITEAIANDEHFIREGAAVPV